MDNILGIIALTIVAIIVFFSLRKEQRRQARYFGEHVPFSKSEQKRLDKYKREYEAIQHDERLPNFDRDGFELMDIAKSACEILYDSPIPTIREKLAVHKGTMVKLIVVNRVNDVERMWVEVDEREGMMFRAVLQNDGYFKKKLKGDKPMWFHSNHIFAIEKMVK